MTDERSVAYVCNCTQICDGIDNYCKHYDEQDDSTMAIAWHPAVTTWHMAVSVCRWMFPTVDCIMVLESQMLVAK